MAHTAVAVSLLFACGSKAVFQKLGRIMQPEAVTGINVQSIYCYVEK